MLDMKTTMVSAAIGNTVCFCMVLLLWLQNRKRISGVNHWLVFYCLSFSAVILFALRGDIADFLSIVAANTLLVGSFIPLLIGLERFAKVSSNQTHNFLLLAVLFILLYYYTYEQPSLVARSIGIEFILIVICTQCAWLMLYKIDGRYRSLTVGVGALFLAFCVLAVARILSDIWFTRDEVFLKANLATVLLVMVYQVLYVALTFGLFLMVNRKLIMDLEMDLVKRKKTEKEKERLIVELREAIQKVKTLSGFLPICASCKKIRDDRGYWSQIEVYIEKHSEALFSHGICPDCLKEYYPKTFEKKRKKGTL